MAAGAIYKLIKGVQHVFKNGKWSPVAKKSVAKRGKVAKKVVKEGEVIKKVKPVGKPKPKKSVIEGTVVKRNPPIAKPKVKPLTKQQKLARDQRKQAAATRKKSADRGRGSNWLSRNKTALATGVLVAGGGLVAINELEKIAKRKAAAAPKKKKKAPVKQKRATAKKRTSRRNVATDDFITQAKLDRAKRKK